MKPYDMWYTMMYTVLITNAIICLVALILSICDFCLGVNLPYSYTVKANTAIAQITAIQAMIYPNNMKFMLIPYFFSACSCSIDKPANS